MSNLKKSKFNRIILTDDILWLLPPISDKKTKPIFWDSESFRPNLRKKLKNNLEYKSSILFDKENLPNGDIIYFPRKITVLSTNKIFVTIR
jgi:hypothetical protein